MTVNARAHFTANGKMKRPQNPTHEFQLWHWFCQWQLASDNSWCELSEKGHLITSFIQWAKVESTGGASFTRIIIGPLAIRTAWLKSNVAV